MYRYTMCHGHLTEPSQVGLAAASTALVLETSLFCLLGPQSQSVATINKILSVEAERKPMDSSELNLLTSSVRLQMDSYLCPPGKRLPPAPRCRQVIISDGLFAVCTQLHQASHCWETGYCVKLFK